MVEGINIDYREDGQIRGYVCCSDGTYHELGSDYEIADHIKWLINYLEEPETLTKISTLEIHPLILLENPTVFSALREFVKNLNIISRVSLHFDDILHGDTDAYAQLIINILFIFDGNQIDQLVLCNPVLIPNS
jgi:hypothetical protein